MLFRRDKPETVEEGLARVIPETPAPLDTDALEKAAEALYLVHRRVKARDMEALPKMVRRMDNAAQKKLGTTWDTIDESTRQDYRDMATASLVVYLWEVG